MSDENYENAKPEDLVVLNDTLPSVFTEAELKTIDGRRWYSVDGLILIRPESENDEFDFSFLTSAAEYGLAFNAVQKIDRCLYRWNETDGFYHA